MILKLTNHAPINSYKIVTCETACFILSLLTPAKTQTAYTICLNNFIMSDLPSEDHVTCSLCENTRAPELILKCFICECDFCSYCQPIEHWSYRKCKHCGRNTIRFCSVYCRMVDYGNLMLRQCKQCDTLVKCTTQHGKLKQE